MAASLQRFRSVTLEDARHARKESRGAMKATRSSEAGLEARLEKIYRQDATKQQHVSPEVPVEHGHTKAQSFCSLRLF